jgi:hypothetical protein
MPSNQSFVKANLLAIRQTDQAIAAPLPKASQSPDLALWQRGLPG